MSDSRSYRMVWRVVADPRSRKHASSSWFLDRSLVDAQLAGYSLDPGVERWIEVLCPPDETPVHGVLRLGERCPVSGEVVE